MTSQANDPEALRLSRLQRANESTVRRETSISDVKAVMSKAFGRRFVYEALAECGIFSSSLRDGPELVLFNEGRRDAGLRLLAKVQGASPANYFKMLKENA